MDHAVYLTLAILTHALVGYALVRVLTFRPPALGVVGGVLPDVDLYFGHLLDFPLVHRGLVHTPVFLALLLGGLHAIDAPAGVPLALGLGFLSHLVIDSFTNAGVMWLYPITARHFAFDVSAHGVPGHVILWVGALALVRWGGRGRLRRPDSGDRRRRGTR